jgi:hypothetical protein
MSKKKQAGKDDKKKGDDGDKPEFEGPSIYDELIEKEVAELEVHLDAPIEILLKENIEFEVLTERLQSEIDRY